jgi:hypothetical protein
LPRAAGVAPTDAWLWGAAPTAQERRGGPFHQTLSLADCVAIRAKWKRREPERPTGELRIRTWTELQPSTLRNWSALLSDSSMTVFGFVQPPSG